MQTDTTAPAARPSYRTKSLARAIEAGWQALRLSAIEEWRRDEDETLTAEQFDQTVEWTGATQISIVTGLVWYEVRAAGEVRWWADAQGTAFPWDVVDAEDTDLGDQIFHRGH